MYVHSILIFFEGTILIGLSIMIWDIGHSPIKQPLWAPYGKHGKLWYVNYGPPYQYFLIKNYIYIKRIIICDKFAEKWCFIIVIYLVHVTRLICIKSIVWTSWRSFILFGRFNLEASNVCKVLMRKSHNLSIDVKVTINIGGPSWRNHCK